MILGIGSDLCDIRRIERSLARFGERFTHRVFTPGERTKSDARATRAASYARRFAAKEACAKALGTGLRAGVFWRDMEVVNLPSGQPTLRLTGGAAERLAEERRRVRGLVHVRHGVGRKGEPRARAARPARGRRTTRCRGCGP